MNVYVDKQTPYPTVPQDDTRGERQPQKPGTPYVEMTDVMLDDMAFRAFEEHHRQKERRNVPTRGDITPGGLIHCTRVMNQQTGEWILMNGEWENGLAFSAISD